MDDTQTYGDYLALVSAINTGLSFSTYMYIYDVRLCRPLHFSNSNDRQGLFKKKVDTDLSGQMCLKMRKPHLVNARLSEAIAKVFTIFAKLSGRHVDT